MSPATGRSRRPASEEASVAGWLLIAMGVLTIVLPSLSLGGRWSSVLAAASGRAASGVAGASSARGRWLSTLVLGAVYGLARFCSGPVLGAILTLDSSALEFGAQDAVAAWTADVPVWVAPVAVALVAGVVAIRRAASREHAPSGRGHDAEDPSGPHRSYDP